MAGTTAVVDFPTTGNNRAYAFAASAYVPVDATATFSSTTASAFAASVTTTSTTTCTVSGSYKLALRIACVIGGDVPPAPAPDTGSITATTSEVS